MALSACGFHNTPSGPEQHESRSIELDKSERVRVELNMHAGQLNIRGGAQKLMDANFAYNVAAWKPEVVYRTTGTAADLIVEQRGPTSSTGKTKNTWDLRFNDKVPIDFRARFGAGEGRLDLGDLNLRGVDIEMGAGTLVLDLRGNPTQDYSVRVRGGVGEAKVYVPKDVGISATASGGIGSISVTGLEKRGDRYVNDAEGRSGVRIRLDIVGGVGEIKLIAE